MKVKKAETINLLIFIKIQKIINQVWALIKFKKKNLAKKLKTKKNKKLKKYKAYKINNYYKCINLKIKLKIISKKSHHKVLFLTI